MEGGGKEDDLAGKYNSAAAAIDQSSRHSLGFHVSVSLAAVVRELLYY